jgi:hypothetical protein
MSDIRESVRSILTQFVETHDQHLPIDVMRVIEEEAMLMKETEAVREALDMDPMEQFQDCRKEVNRFKELLRVSSCTRMRASDDYCLIEATLDVKESFQLHFRYERTRQREAPDGCHVWYSIQMNQNFGQKENLLVVQLFCPKIVPCTTKTAICLNEKVEVEGSDDDEDDGWEDISDSETAELNMDQKSRNPPENDSSSPDAKKQKLSNDEKSSQDEEADKFVVFLDPEVLENFLELARLRTLNEATAFFLLMTLPFYEHEWDIVGYVLDSVFGGSESEEEEEEQEGAEE